MPPNPHNLSEEQVQLDARMKDYNKSLAIEAKRVVFETFPQKCDTTILTLPPHIPTDATFHSGGQQNGDFAAVSSSSTAAHPGKSGDGAGGMAEEGEEKSMRTGMKTNPAFKLMGQALEKEGEEAMSVCMSLRRWLATVTPPVEEGNNTGVEIQEMALGYLNSLQNLSSDCMNYLTTARQNRATLVRAYLRTPGIEDRLLSVEEGDRIELAGGRQILMLLQSRYIDTMNVFQKNWQKICEPKGQRPTWD